MNRIVQKACELLEREQAFVLATIVSHQGSTPRTSGSQMIVTADGRGTGTIGGGLLEAGAMARAVELLASGQSAVLPFDLSHQTVATMDMICGGSAEVLLDCVTPSEENLAAFGQWRRLVEGGKKGGFLFVVFTSGKAVDRVVHCVVTEDLQIQGEFPLPAPARKKAVAAVQGADSMQTLSFNDAFVVAVPAARICTAHLFGAGHVAQPTAHLAAMVGFRVCVFDDRAEYANGGRFPDAHEIRVLESFEHAFDGLAMDRDDFAVIFTRGHLHDRTVLAQVLATDAGYVGMIGSRKKRDAIYKALLEQGVTRAQIDRVHSPIGLSIGAETPEEIAVSIVAELIACRAQGA